MSDNRRQYTTTDIRLYLEGKLSPEEMHALEAAALEDPFLADAIEGMQTAHSFGTLKTFEQDVADAQKQLEKRISGKAAISMLPRNNMWWRAAAVAAILIIGLTVTFLLWDKSDAGNAIVAKKEESKIAPDTEKSDTERVSSYKTVTDSASQQQPVGASSQKTDKIINPNPATKPVIRQEEYNPPAPQRIQEHKDEAAKNAPPSPDEQEVQAEKAEAQSYSKKKAVTADNKTPVPARDQAQNRAAGVKVATDTLSQDVFPSDGWENYNTYLTRQRIDTSVVTAKVTVSFIVSTKGGLSGFGIVSSTNKSYNKKAIRIIKNGPGWTSKLNKDHRTQIEIVF